MTGFLSLSYSTVIGEPANISRDLCAASNTNWHRLDTFSTQSSTVTRAMLITSSIVLYYKHFISINIFNANQLYKNRYSSVSLNNLIPSVLGKFLISSFADKPSNGCFQEGSMSIKGLSTKIRSANRG